MKYSSQNQKLNPELFKKKRSLRNIEELSGKLKIDPGFYGQESIHLLVGTDDACKLLFH